MRKIKTLLTCLFLPSLAMAQVTSPSSTLSMELSTTGVSQIIQGSSNILAAGGQLTIVAVSRVGEFMDITMRAAANLSTLTIRVAKDAVGNSLIAAGQTIKVISVSGGNLVYAAGQLIAFLPNEIGKSLIYSKKI
ncbi:hypothetical protein ACNVED_09290 [Legionella sp. D16C41]|uniref:hypothetical protein n=1 Tax=Legionella sp. D16C41 TaxID=3402688 RepID=UPI003AF99234